MSVLFEERLREAMTKAGINQSELSRLAGVSKASISQYLSNKNEPKHQVIEKFAEILGVDEAWLDGHSDEPMMLKPKILKPHHVSKITGEYVDGVRMKMQKNIFDPPIGTAGKYTGNRFTYDIYPEKLAAFLNITVDAVFARLNA